jgi:hypothetical protein
VRAFGSQIALPHQQYQRGQSPETTAMVKSKQEADSSEERRSNISSKEGTKKMMK